MKKLLHHLGLPVVFFALTFNLYGQTPITVSEIIAEATRANNDPIGRPLPLASFWESGDYDYSMIDRPGTFNTPAEQLKWIQQGRHIFPVLRFPQDTSSTRNLHSYYGEAFDQFAEWKLPISFKSTQWESVLSLDPKYSGLPAEQNPNVIALNDSVIAGKVDPMGPIEPWYQAGLDWTSGTTIDENRLSGWKDLEARYPDPPFILMLSNNEHKKLGPTEAETSKRWMDTYGASKSDDFKRETFANDWQTHYKELFRGMHDGLRLSAWKDNLKFAGYGTYNDLRHYSRWGAWKNHSLYYPNNIVSAQRYWDGMSSSPYLAPYYSEPTSRYIVHR